MTRPWHTSSMVLILALAIVSHANAAKHRVDVIDSSPPSGVISKEIVALLSSQGVKVTRGKSRTVCEIWLCKQWTAKAGFKLSGEVLYPFQSGQLIGVVRYSRKGSDFRDQDIAKGVYTMRYAQQPVDGDHVGTSPTRDFLLLVNAEKDKSSKPLSEKDFFELSAEAAGATHPALLSLQKMADPAKTLPAKTLPAKTLPAIEHDEDRDLWSVQLGGEIKVGGKTTKQAIKLVVVGFAEE